MKLLAYIQKRPLILSALLLALIFMHGLFDNVFKVDSTTVLLALLIILLPYFPHFSKIRFGEFEAEISHKAVEDLGERVDSVATPPAAGAPAKKVQELEELAENDPALALAKARIEIEKRLRSLEEIYIPNANAKYRQRGLRELVNDLQKQDILDPPLGALLHDIIAVANQAVHGATIDRSNAVKLAGYASRVLGELDNVVIGRALKSVKTTIAPELVDQYRKGAYILKTVVPLTRKPVLKTYHLNQYELDAYLEGYDEHAEFIVSLEKQT